MTFDPRCSFINVASCRLGLLRSLNVKIYLYQYVHNTGIGVFCELYFAFRLLAALYFMLRLVDIVRHQNNRQDESTAAVLDKVLAARSEGATQGSRTRQCGRLYMPDLIVVFIFQYNQYLIWF